MKVLTKEERSSCSRELGRGTNGEGGDWRMLLKRQGGEQSLRACTGSGRIGMRKDKEEETLRGRGGMMREGRVRQEGEDLLERLNWIVKIKSSRPQKFKETTSENKIQI